MHMGKKRWKRTYLREWRLHAKLTQAQAAEELGYADHTMLSKVERADEKYSQELLENAAELYGCTVFQLLYQRPEDEESPHAIIERLDDRQKKRAVPHLRAILDERS